MIQIPGVSKQVIDKWEFGKIETNIVKQMQEQQMVYSYKSFGELLFELKFRKNIIESAIEMSQSQAKFHIFAGSRCNPQYWHLTKTGGFQLKIDVKPSDAIKDIYKSSSLYAFECATAIIIIYYYASLKSIGEHIFNSIYQNLYLYSWHLDSDFTIHTFYGDQLLPGDVVYFNNPDFDPKTSWWRGQNAVVLTDGKYFGHGFGIWNVDEMIQILNTKRKQGSKQSAYLTKLVTRPIFKNFAYFSTLSRANTLNKTQHTVIHHNKNSIPYVQYLYFLNKFYKS